MAALSCAASFCFASESREKQETRRFAEVRRERMHPDKMLLSRLRSLVAGSLAIARAFLPFERGFE